MGSILQNVPLELLVGSSEYVLKSVSPRYHYDGGQRTETVVGYVYRVVNTESYDSLSVVVPHSQPVVTAEALKATNEAGQHVYVEIDGASVTPYVSKAGTIEDSIKASSIVVIKKN